jgi:hypothetical protein
VLPVALALRVIVGAVQLIVKMPGADVVEVKVTVPVKSKLLVTERITEIPGAPRLKLVPPSRVIVKPPTWINAKPV